MSASNAPFPEVSGKTIDKITVTNTSSFRALSLHFTDRTSLHLSLEPRLMIQSQLIDWRSGNAHTVKEYKSMVEEDGI